MSRILFLNCTAGLCRLGYAFNDLRLSNVFEVPAISSVPVPGLVDIVQVHGIELIVTLVHTVVPDLNGCIGQQASEELKWDRSVEPDCFARWAEGNIKELDPYDHAWQIGQSISTVLPKIPQTLVIFDHKTQTMYPVASRIKGSWLKVNNLWLNAINTGFVAGVPELHDNLVPRAFRLWLKRNRNNNVLRLTAKNCCREGHGRMKNIVLNTTPFPVESITKLRPMLGINGTPIFDVASVVYCPPELPNWWIPQAEALFRDWKYETNITLVSEKEEDLRNLAGVLDENASFQRIVRHQMRSGTIRPLVIGGRP